MDETLFYGHVTQRKNILAVSLIVHTNKFDVEVRVKKNRTCTYYFGLERKK